MKLKFELVNGLGVLVDEKEEIISGDLILWNGKVKTAIDTTYTHPSHKIIFAEKELGIDVPVFEWRDFEVEKLAIKEFPHDTGMSIVARGAFRKGYKSNPAKYTEEDLRKAIEMARRHDVNLHSGRGCTLIPQINNEEIIQSFQKYPSYIVMSMEAINDFGEPYSFDDIDFGVEKEYRFKLFTNSNGKQQGTIKEIIW